MVLAVPSATLKEYSNQIYDDFGLRLTDSAICKFLKEEGVSRKKVEPQSTVSFVNVKAAERRETTERKITRRLDRQTRTLEG
jgi:transposase